MSRIQAKFLTIWERLLALVCTKFVRVRGQSMSPTVAHGEWVRVDRRAYRYVAPSRFDVVLIEHPHRPEFLEVKRVVGLPGEEVALGPTGLTVDGNHTVQPIASKPEDYVREWRLGAGQYIVLGDNRAQSTDSRDFGAVERKHIKGRVMLSNVTHQSRA